MKAAGQSDVLICQVAPSQTGCRKRPPLPQTVAHKVPNRGRLLPFKLVFAQPVATPIEELAFTL